MDKQRVAVMLGMVAKIYGKQVDASDAEVTIELWHRYLCDEPDDLVQLAFDRYIAANIYAPKPAEILELIEQTKSELWHRYGDTSVVRLFGDEARDIPDEYRPRYITKKPKAFERFDLAKMLKSIDGESVKKIEGR